MKKLTYSLFILLAIGSLLFLNSCKSNKEVVDLQSHQFLITLAEKANIGKVLSKFKSYNITDIKNVSKSQNMHTFKASMSDEMVDNFIKKVKLNREILSISKARIQDEKATNGTSVQSGKTKPIKQ